MSSVSAGHRSFPRPASARFWIISRYSILLIRFMARRISTRVGFPSRSRKAVTAASSASRAAQRARLSRAMASPSAAEGMKAQGIDLRQLNLGAIVDVFEELEEDIVNVRVKDAHNDLLVRVYVE